MASFERTSVNLGLRCNVALLLMAICLCIYAFRLWYLQILQGDFFRERSENNRLRAVFIPPPRGLIRDREGKVLVRNRAAFNVELVTEDSPDPKASLRQLAHVLDLRGDDLVQKFYNQPKRRRFEPKLILKDVSRDVVAKVVAHSYDLPGIVVNVIPAREYIYSDLAAHVIGYIREITAGQLKDPRFTSGNYQYRQGDLVGQYGIEALWELDLQGQRGQQAVIVNANGVRIAESSFEPEVSGNNLTLTIDYDVQKAADDAMSDKKGAVVAMDPNSGEILALSSAPRFDPNMFAGEINAAEWAELVGGKARRLNNRAVQGAFPPGSVFKIFMAAAGLSEGVVTPSTHISCPGYYFMGSRRFKCHKHEGHGSVDLHQAIIKSCDVFFYTVGQRLGVDRIHDYAERFGLGVLTGLDLVAENPGLVPSTAWKRSHFKRPEDQKWYPGETPSVSIGQGAVTLTPLQITRGISAVVNGGYLRRPRLILGGDSNTGSWRYGPSAADAPKSIEIDPKVLEQVRQGMQGVVSEPGGTGRRAQLGPEFEVSVGGKTGTAQVVGEDAGAKGEHFEDHAWFTGYAPTEMPEIVVTALVENGGHGGVTAAPVVRQVMEAYFRKQCQVEPQKCRIKAAPAETPAKDVEKHNAAR